MLLALVGGLHGTVDDRDLASPRLPNLRKKESRVYGVMRDLVRQRQFNIRAFTGRLAETLGRLSIRLDSVRDVAPRPNPPETGVRDY